MTQIKPVDIKWKVDYTNFFSAAEIEVVVV